MSVAPTSLEDKGSWRVLPPNPFASLDEYVASGGGAGLAAARRVAPEVVIDEIIASGLVGRGGAGFPTGEKWRTIRASASPRLRTTVVVNAAEGEPGTFKDRAIMVANPYAVVEGALIAAWAMDASEIVIATKLQFDNQRERVRSAIAEVEEANWGSGISLRIVDGPAEYLFGEETALLEVIDGRPPFPRIAPPYRRGVHELVRSDSDVSSGSGLAANIQMASPGDETEAPPVLVNNVETMANVPAIVAKGATWFREVGTNESPGTIVCTVTGDVDRPGVCEVPMGTSLRNVIERAGGGAIAGRKVKMVLVGVSSSVLSHDDLDVALSHEAMRDLGSGLGSAGFIVVGDDKAAVGVASGVAHFLAIESCGQCTPCKDDGLALSALLGSAAQGQASPHDLTTVIGLIATVADGARCSLARQQQTVLNSILGHFTSEIEDSFQPGAPPVEPMLIAELLSVEGASAEVDQSFRNKQPDWSFDQIDSGKTPVERFTDHRSDEPTATAAATDV